MTVPEDMAERHGRLLARYAELSLSLAEDVHAAAVAAPEPDEKARLAGAFHRLGRAMRQSIALEAKVVRDHARDLKAAEADAGEARAQAARRRRDQVRADVERRIYTEIDPDEADAWLADLDERLETEALYDDFIDESVEEHIERLAAELGLTGEANHDYTPRSIRPRALEKLRRARDYDRLSRAWFGDDEGKGKGEGEDADDGPPDPPPISHPAEAPDPAPPPDPRELEPPPPEPPPRPPDPYIPPWDRRPGARFPGGSGY